MQSSPRNKTDILGRFGITEAELDKLEEDATQGILHGEPRGEVIRKNEKEPRR